MADADKIKAAIEDTAKTARAIAGAASTISERLAVIRRSHLLVQRFIDFQSGYLVS